MLTIDRGVWLRGISRSLDTRQHGTVAQRNDADIQGWQVGVDLARNARHRFGVYGGRLDWESDVSGFASGVGNRDVGGLEGHSNYLGAYWTYAADAGWYSDLVLQQGWHDGDAGRGDAGGRDLDARRRQFVLDGARGQEIESGYSVSLGVRMTW